MIILSFREDKLFKSVFILLQFGMPKSSWRYFIIRFIKPWLSKIWGTSKTDETSGISSTALSGTSAKNAILFKVFLSNDLELLVIITSGVIPNALNSRTAICVGLVLCSCKWFGKGTYVNKTNSESSSGIFRLSCLIASKKCLDSISPMVPPTSTIIISDSFCWTKLSILWRISSIIWGTTCTVFPKYSPFLSLEITL